MKKIRLIMITMILVIFSIVPSWAAEETSRIDPEPFLPYTYINSLSVNLNITGSTALCYISMPIKAEKRIDYVQITATLKNSSGTTKKTFKDKVYPGIGNIINWTKNYKLEEKGTYYLQANLNLYKGGKIIETVNGKSVNKKY